MLAQDGTDTKSEEAADEHGGENLLLLPGLHNLLTSEEQKTLVGIRVVQDMVNIGEEFK